jgi:alpha-L-fucosidase 2
MVAVEGGIHVATNAAPIENGRLGAMLWGGIDSERLQLNRNKLFPWCPCPT